MYSVTTIAELTAHTFFTSQDPLVRVIFQALFISPSSLCQLLCIPLAFYPSACKPVSLHLQSECQCLLSLPLLPRAGKVLIASALLMNVSPFSVLPVLKEQERWSEWFLPFSSSRFFSLHTKGCVCSHFSSLLSKTDFYPWGSLIFCFPVFI